MITTQALESFVSQARSGGLPIDLDPASFPAGAVATSAIETITVTVHNRGEAFDVYCQRSYADSLAEWLESALR